MRLISEDFRARLSGATTTLAHVWAVTRRDGARFAFTDHDRDLAFDDLIARAQSGLAPQAIEKTCDLAPDVAAAEGALSSAAVSAEDLAAGLWDGAAVDVWRVDWRAPEHRAHLFAGRLGEVEARNGAFVAELRGLKAGLDRRIGRVISRLCDAEFADARCGVAPEDPRWRGAGAILAPLGPQSFRASGLGAFASGLFSGGRLFWDGGGEADVAAHAGERIELADAPSAPLQAGRGFVIRAGCDKTLATCRDRFANTLNHRGFPHLPGADALIAVAQPGGHNDGGSRWR